MTWDFAKEIIQKAITVGIVAIGAAISEGAPIEYRALAMVFFYAIWTKVLAPRIEDFFTEEGTHLRTDAAQEKSGFDLI